MTEEKLLTSEEAAALQPDDAGVADQSPEPDVEV
jgi:hypothetical protein